jgi:hypothetical protein
MSQSKISATNSKLGRRKLSIDIRRGYPNALIFSTKPRDVGMSMRRNHPNQKPRPTSCFLIRHVLVRDGTGDGTVWMSAQGNEKAKKKKKKKIKSKST